MVYKLSRILIATALVAAATTSSQAALITGSIGFSQDTGVITTSPAGGPFNAFPYSISTSGAAFSTVGASGTGNFTGLGNLALAMSPSTLTLTNGATVSPVTLVFDGYTFTSSAGSVAVSSSNLVQILYSGTVTSGADSNSTTLVTLTFQRTTASSPITFAGSLVAQQVVPEPSSIALAGIGLAAAGVFGLRKRLAK